jgi:rhodanese-related sulfurtransferase
VKKVFAEAVLVALVGVAFSFVANALSSRGLKLTKNYFPGEIRDLAPSSQNPTNSSAQTKSPAQLAIERLHAKNLQVAEDQQVISLFKDAKYQQGTVIIIDARKDEEYQRGHIPGAYEFDRMYAEKYLGSVLPASASAQQIIVYCHGGPDCEESEFAAVFLREAGVPNEKLFIYAGGITDWQNRKLPIESGDRNSGQFTNSPK